MADAATVRNHDRVVFNGLGVHKAGGNHVRLSHLPNSVYKSGHKVASHSDFVICEHTDEPNLLNPPVTKGNLHTIFELFLTSLLTINKISEIAVVYSGTEAERRFACANESSEPEEAGERGMVAATIFAYKSADKFVSELLEEIAHIHGDG